MKERNWTPGPWVVKFSHGDTAIYMDGECTMCDMTYYPWVPENINDWHLIAAAPDLYEALELMRHEYRTALRISGVDERTSKTMATANAALAKARGEA